MKSKQTLSPQERERMKTAEVGGSISLLMQDCTDQLFVSVALSQSFYLSIAEKCEDRECGQCRGAEEN